MSREAKAAALESGLKSPAVEDEEDIKPAAKGKKGKPAAGASLFDLLDEGDGDAEDDEEGGGGGLLVCPLLGLMGHGAD